MGVPLKRMMVIPYRNTEVKDENCFSFVFAGRATDGVQQAGRNTRRADLAEEDNAFLMLTFTEVINETISQKQEKTAVV